MKDCMQQNPVYGWDDFASSGARTQVFLTKTDLDQTVQT